KWRHDYGSAIAAFQEAGGENKRGWFTDLTTALGESDSNLRKHRQFARVFSLEEAQELDQAGCNWGLVTRVLHLPDKAECLKWLAKAREKGWNLEELDSEIAKKHERNHPGGRP